MKQVIIRSGSSDVLVQEVSDTDVTISPSGSSVICGEHYDSLVSSFGEPQILGIIGASKDYSKISIDELKKIWLQKILSDAASSFVKGMLIDPKYKEVIDKSSKSITDAKTAEEVQSIKFEPPL